MPFLLQLVARAGKYRQGRGNDCELNLILLVSTCMILVHQPFSLVFWLGFRKTERFSVAKAMAICKI